MHRSVIKTDKSKETSDPYIEVRRRMVDEQIKKRGIKQPGLIAAMLKVPRHLFVQQKYSHMAYFDEPLPIPCGQTISQPYVVSLMTSLLELEKDSRVLEIGTGSGYHTAILAELAGEVFTIELEPDLHHSAAKLLEDLGYQNIRFKQGDGKEGWEEYKPFDAILLTAAPEKVPERVVTHLNDGGRMVLPEGTIDQELILIEKSSDGYTTAKHGPVRFVPLR